MDEGAPEVKSHLLPLKLLSRFHRHSLPILRVPRTRLVSCEGHWDIREFTLIMMQSSNPSHNEWLASLFSSSLLSPELPDNFL